MRDDIESLKNNSPTVGCIQSEIDFNAGYDFALKQVLNIIPHWESKHQEELSNYNSYAASEVGERWQNEIDKLVSKYEKTFEILKDVGGAKHIATKNYQSFISDLKGLTID